MTTLTITHTHEAGTLIEGTSKGDGTADVLKRVGWRWGRSIAAWYVPNSRDHLPHGYKINRTVQALEAAGFEVTTELSIERRPTTEVEAGKIARQADRLDALEAKADRKATADAAAWKRVEGAMARLPEGGEPIHVGHHSERRHRNAIKKADTAMRRSVEASAAAEHARGEADAAAMTTDRRYQPVTVANRIETLGAEIRKLERQITAPRLDAEGGYVPATPEQIEAARARLNPYIDEKRDQLAYWEGVRAAQIESGTATGYSRENVQKSDRVKVRGHWYPVVRVNAKSVSVQTPYSWTDTVPYAELQDLSRPE